MLIHGRSTLSVSLHQDPEYDAGSYGPGTCSTQNPPQHDTLHAWRHKWGSNADLRRFPPPFIYFLESNLRTALADDTFKLQLSHIPSIYAISRCRCSRLMHDTATPPLRNLRLFDVPRGNLMTHCSHTNPAFDWMWPKQQSLFVWHGTLAVPTVPIPKPVVPTEVSSRMGRKRMTEPERL